MVPGTGSRVLLAGVHGVGAEACHVAITWVTIHAKILQQMLNPGSPVRHLLFTAKEDVKVITTQVDCGREGTSLGACVALALVCQLTRCGLVADRVGVTGELDLRGRLLPVSGLADKALAAKNAKVSMMIIPEESFKALNAQRFAEVAEDAVREYALDTFRGAATMMGVFSHAIQGATVIHAHKQMVAATQSPTLNVFSRSVTCYMAFPQCRLRAVYG